MNCRWYCNEICINNCTQIVSVVNKNESTKPITSPSKKINEIRQNISESEGENNNDYDPMNDFY